MDYYDKESIYFKTLDILHIDIDNPPNCTYVNCELDKTQFSYQLLTINS